MLSGLGLLQLLLQVLLPPLLPLPLLHPVERRQPQPLPAPPLALHPLPVAAESAVY